MFEVIKFLTRNTTQHTSEKTFYFNMYIILIIMINDSLCKQMAGEEHNFIPAFYMTHNIHTSHNVSNLSLFANNVNLI